MSLLASNLKHRKFKVKTTFLKRGHLLSYFLEASIARIIIRKKTDYSIRTIAEQRPILLKNLLKLFLFLDTISISYRFFVTVYLPKKLGYVILVEEYMQAAIADYITLSKFVDFDVRKLSLSIKVFSGLAHVGGPFQTIFLDAPDSSLRSRWVQRKSPVQRSDYLVMQRTLLYSVSKALSASVFYINTGDLCIQKTGAMITDKLSLQCSPSKNSMTI